MNIEEIKELMDALVERDVDELEVERGDERIRIRRRTPSEGQNQAPYIVMASGTPVADGTVPPAVAASPSAPAASPPTADQPAPAASEEDENHSIITAPLIGTFYEAPEPGAEPFVRVGDRVEAGQALCIVEAMKLMNEIEAETGGVVVKRFVSDRQPVEYGDALFAIKPGP